MNIKLFRIIGFTIIGLIAIFLIVFIGKIIYKNGVKAGKAEYQIEVDSLNQVQLDSMFNDMMYKIELGMEKSKTYYNNTEKTIEKIITNYEIINDENNTITDPDSILQSLNFISNYR